MQSPDEPTSELDSFEAVLETGDDLVLLLHTIQKRNYLGYLGGSSAPECKTYSQEEVYSWN